MQQCVLLVRLLMPIAAMVVSHFSFIFACGTLQATAAAMLLMVPWLQVFILHSLLHQDLAVMAAATSPLAMYYLGNTLPKHVLLDSCV